MERFTIGVTMDRHDEHEDAPYFVVVLDYGKTLLTDAAALIPSLRVGATVRLSVHTDDGLITWRYMVGGEKARRRAA